MSRALKYKEERYYKVVALVGSKILTTYFWTDYKEKTPEFTKECVAHVKRRFNYDGVVEIIAFERSGVVGNE